MLSYILISIISYILGILTIILFSIIKISSKYTKEEKQDYGQIAYEELERRENEGK